MSLKFKIEIGKRNKEIHIKTNNENRPNRPKKKVKKRRKPRRYTPPPSNFFTREGVTPDTVPSPYNVVPIHRHPQLKEMCCKLINEEWPRSDVARMRSLDASCDRLPTSLVLTRDDNRVLLAHLKLTPFIKDKESCFVESVVVDRNHRGQGLGTIIMKYAEEYCAQKLHIKTIYLSTFGQERFYEKLGYTVCDPVSVHGTITFVQTIQIDGNRKTYMSKQL